MSLKDLTQRALVVRRAYDVLNESTYGASWTKQELMQGLVGDIGDLSKLIMAKEGRREGPPNLDEKLAHEMSDVLWCLLVLADGYNIDLEKSFHSTMDALEKHIAAKHK